MRIDELIQRLRDARQAYGNLPVTYACPSFGQNVVEDVRVWTASGRAPDGRKKRTDPAVEIELF